MNKNKQIYFKIYVASIIVFLFCLVFYKNFFKDFFISGGTDRFMDFFNSVRDAKNGEVYSVCKVIYPPLINIVFFLVGKCFNRDLLYTSFSDRYLMQNDMLSILIYILFTVLILLLLLYFILLGKGTLRFKITLYFTIVFSMPMVWAIERGNIIILAFAFIIGFVNLYNSDNKHLRALAVVCLALATAIKIYPVFLVLLYLFKKRYKAFIASGFLMFLFCIVPFVFYDGINGMIYMIKSILRFEESHMNSFSAYCTSIGAFLGFFGFKLNTIVILMVDAIYLYLAYKSSEDYIKVLMIILVMLSFSGSQIVYNSIYLIVPLVMIFNKKDMVKLDLLIMILLEIVIIPIAIKVPYFHTVLWELAIFPVCISLGVLPLIEHFNNYRSVYNITDL